MPSRATLRLILLSFSAIAAMAIQPAGAQEAVMEETIVEDQVDVMDHLIVDEQELRRAGFGATLLREGALLPKGKGRIRMLPSGHWVFIFDRDQLGGVSLPPMVLLPCMNLTAMEQLVQGRDEDVRFVVSGQVFVYQGRNYLLPTSHAIETVDEEAVQDEIIGEDAEPANPEDPSIDELLRELDEATPRRREIVPPPVGAANRPGLRREGSLLRLRRGRVVLSPLGEWVFTFDNDPESPIDLDAPMRLLPCQNLEGIEELQASYEDSLTYRMSGRVFVYDGVNYLMPTMYMVDFDPSSNLVLGQ